MAKTYQWRRIVGGTPTPISGATASTYELVEDDEGATIDCAVTNGGVTAYADAVGPVEAAETRRYPTLLNVPGSQFSEIVQSQPALATPVQFGSLDTVVVRVTNDSEAHRYATLQAFNADQTKLLLYSSILDTSDWSALQSGIDKNMVLQFWDPVDANAIWGHQDWSNQIGRWDITGSPVDFFPIPPPSGSAYTSVVIGENEGSISNDGRYIPVVCRRGDGNVYVAVWDTVEEEVEGTLVLTGWSVGGSGLDNALISQSGTYLIVTSHKSGEEGHLVYDRATLTFLYRYDGNGYGASHADCGYRSNGDECLVRAARSDTRLVSVRLSDGNVQDEVAWNLFNGSFHVSCRNIKRPGYAYISGYYNPDSSTYRYYREVYAIPLDGTGKIERFGQAMFPAESAYELEAKATVSPYGDIVLMSSGWGTTTPREYVMYVPEVMP